MIYGAIFVAVSLLAALGLHAPRLAKGCGALIALVLFAFAALRSDSTDYEQYVAMYDLMRATNNVAWPLRLLIGKDPMFGGVILGVVTLGLSAQWLFVSAAALSVGVKWAAFGRAFGNAAAALLVTLFGYYFLHDFTQIRSAIAIPFCFIALQDACSGRPWRAALWTAFGATFHASAILCLPMIWLTTLDGRRAYLATLVFVVLAIAFARITYSHVADFDDRTAMQADKTGTSLTPLVVATLRMFVLLGIHRAIRERWPAMARVLRACMILCLAAVPFLFGLRGLSSTMAFRFYELLDAFSVFILAAALIRGPILARLAALALCIASIIVHVHNGLLGDYVLARG